MQQDFLETRPSFIRMVIWTQSFGGNRRVISTPVGAGNDAGEALTIQQDGKIVVAGSAVGNQKFNFALVRYNTNGALDNSFCGDSGKGNHPNR